ncbi:glycerophosphodiester phosphodiesterase family protein [Gilvimarinus polysaccharolyticus]|uniref:glycerophosphodiester phosphodiesterase family protein n=1 Tax=Gilvimarinus polysaccharolyticus TaxID=863921 RepID=UPI0006734E8D|nr:glycerophosphodiester phosphodiesterase family protein [Gilvimarinus polysaccharolyticus]
MAYYLKSILITILAVAIVIAAGFNLYQQRASVSTPGFCSISNWGPRSTNAGTGFNVQPGGQSALWVITSCYPDNVAISFDGQPYSTTHYPSSLTALITDLSSIAQAGDVEVSLLNKATGRRQHVGLFTVIDANDTKQTAELPKEPSITPPLLIAHAAGGFEGRRYRNSMEALEFNYKLGHRLFEVDFNWTSDNQLVGIHDWGNSYKRLFKNADHAQAPSYEQLLSLVMDNNEAIITLPRLKNWLAKKPDAYIVTDIKGDNVQALALMKSSLEEQYKQVIPQLYHPSNYQELQQMGFHNIIFTLYKTHLSSEQIIKFVANNPLLAITVHPDKAGFADLVPAFNKLHRFVYVHTYNTLADYDKYTALGIDGLYTDFLYQDARGDVRRQGQQ